MGLLHDLVRSAAADDFGALAVVAALFYLAWFKTLSKAHTTLAGIHAQERSNAAAVQSAEKVRLAQIHSDEVVQLERIRSDERLKMAELQRDCAAAGTSFRLVAPRPVPGEARSQKLHVEQLRANKLTSGEPAKN